MSFVQLRRCGVSLSDRCFMTCDICGENTCSLPRGHVGKHVCSNCPSVVVILTRFLHGRATLQEGNADCGGVCNTHGGSCIMGAGHRGPCMCRIVGCRGFSLICVRPACIKPPIYSRRCGMTCAYCDDGCALSPGHSGEHLCSFHNN